MDNSLTARDLANLQLEYYNAHDLDKFCALFHPDCELVNHRTGEMILNTQDAFRDFYRDRFSNPDLHCIVTNRMDHDNIAIDQEVVSGISDDPLHIIAIYEASDGLIKRVSFIRD